MIEQSVKPSVRNWPVIVLDAVLLVVYGLLFLFMVGLPFMAWTGMFSEPGIPDFLNLPRTVDEALFFLEENILGFFTLLGAVLLFVLIVSTAALFVFGATVGVIARSVREPGYRFSLAAFMSEGRHLFFPLMWLTLLLSLILLAVAAVTFPLGILWVMGVNLFFALETVPGYFLGIFLTLLGVSLVVGLVLMLWTVSSYALVVLVIRRTRSREALAEAVYFLKNEPKAILFFLGLSAIYMGAVIGVSMMTMAFNSFPVMGHLFWFAGQVLGYLCNRSFNIMFLTALIGYFLEMTMPGEGPLHPSVREAGGGATDGSAADDENAFAEGDSHEATGV